MGLALVDPIHRQDTAFMAKARGRFIETGCRRAKMTADEDSVGEGEGEDDDDDEAAAVACSGCRLGRGSRTTYIHRNGTHVLPRQRTQRVSRAAQSSSSSSSAGAAGPGATTTSAARHWRRVLGSGASTSASASSSSFVPVPGGVLAPGRSSEAVSYDDDDGHPAVYADMDDMSEDDEDYAEMVHGSHDEDETDPDLLPDGASTDPVFRMHRAQLQSELWGMRHGSLIYEAPVSLGPNGVVRQPAEFAGEIYPFTLHHGACDHLTESSNAAPASQTVRLPSQPVTGASAGGARRPNPISADASLAAMRSLDDAASRNLAPRRPQRDSVPPAGTIF